MKRAKFLLLALVVAIMMMGAGYAIWNEELMLESKVNTGKFDMEITKTTIRTGDDQQRNEVHDWHHFDWTHGVTSQVLEGGNAAYVEFRDLYPGGTVQIDMKFENKGTIPAKLKSARVEFIDGDEDLFNLLRAQTSWKADINGDGAQDDWEHVENWQYWRPLQSALNKLVESTNNNNLVIEPGGWFTLGSEGEDEFGCIQIKLDPSAGNEFQETYCRFKITFDWEQWASDPTANPYNDGALPGYGGDGDIQEIESRN